MRTFLIIVSSLISIIAVVPYLLDVARGRDKPRIATWLVWAVLAGIGSAAAFSSHQIPAGVFTLVTGLEAAAVAVLGFEEGDRKFERLDIGCLLAAGVSLVLLVFLKSPTAAIVLVICADAVGTIPTLKHCWQHPYEETWMTYGLFVLAEIIILTVADFRVFAAFAYPAFYLLEDGTLAAFVLFSPHRNDKPVVAPAAAAPPAAMPVVPPTTVMPTAGPPPPVVVNPVTVVPPAERPPVPLELKVSSPTQVPTLRWQAVTAAVSYNIYRNETLLGSSKVATFVDTTATDGSYSYQVTAVGQGGESDKSNTADVRVDQTPPDVSYKVSDQPNSAGWHRRPVTVTFVGSDPKAGIASCTEPVTLSGDGANQAVTGSAMNYAGATSSITAVINIDQTPPTLGAPVWSSNPVEAGQEVTVSVSVADHSSGVAGGEYVGRVDQGQGHGRPMALKDGNLSITLNTNVHPGSYPINIRAIDVAGNWSALETTMLVVEQKR